MATRRTPRTVEPKEPHPATWAEAQRLAAGRRVYLVAQPDGSVKIVNHPDQQ